MEKGKKPPFLLQRLTLVQEGAGAPWGVCVASRPGSLSPAPPVAALTPDQHSQDSMKTLFSADPGISLENVFHKYG